MMAIIWSQKQGRSCRGDVTFPENTIVDEPRRCDHARISYRVQYYRHGLWYSKRSRGTVYPVCGASVDRVHPSLTLVDFGGEVRSHALATDKRRYAGLCYTRCSRVLRDVAGRFQLTRVNGRTRRRRGQRRCRTRDDTCRPVQGVRDLPRRFRTTE